MAVNGSSSTRRTANTPTLEPDSVSLLDKLWCKVFDHDYRHGFGEYTDPSSGKGRCRHCGKTITDEELALYALKQSSYQYRLGNAAWRVPLDKDYIRAVADSHGIKYECDESAAE